MKTITTADRALRKILLSQCDLITRHQALDGLMSEAQLRSRLRAGGAWSVILPGIYLAHNGLLTVGQRELAAVLYAGPDGIITGAAALARQGVRVPQTEDIDVLVPHDRRRQSTEFVRIHRTRRMPSPRISDDLRWAPTARAVSDAIRGRNDLKSACALVADAVQAGKCTVEQLTRELHAGASRGSGALRAALEDVAAGAASAAEADLHRLMKRGNLPQPLYNPQLYIGADFLAKPDAWWPACGVACEVDSREWHIKPADWERTLARHARMSAHGIIVIHLTPRRIRTEADRVVAELRSALESGRKRPPLKIHTIPRS